MDLEIDLVKDKKRHHKMILKLKDLSVIIQLRTYTSWEPSYNLKRVLKKVIKWMKNPINLSKLKSMAV